MIRGNGVSKGVALAKQRLLNLELTAEKEFAADPELELERLKQARQLSVSRQRQTIERMKQQFGADEEEVFDFREQLEERYHRILEIRMDNERTRRKLQEEIGALEIPDPVCAFAAFFEAVRHVPLSEEQEKIMREIIAEAEEEEHR